MIFWLVCSVLILIALAFVLPPLLRSEEKSNAAEVKEANVAIYRDQLRELEGDLGNGIVSQEQYDQDREEIERRLLDDISRTAGAAKAPGATRNLAYALGVALPVVAVVFYLQLANQNARTAAQPAPEPQAATAPPFANQAGEMTPQAIEANVKTLAARLEKNPNDAPGWIMLARSYGQMQRYKDAAEAYEHATALDSKNADLWADYAFAVAMINGKEMQGKPMELINKALAIDPQNRNALMLAGKAAFSNKEYDKAIQYWEKLLKTLPANSTEIAQPLGEKIAEAKRLAKTAGTK